MIRLSVCMLNRQLQYAATKQPRYMHAFRQTLQLCNDLEVAATAVAVKSDRQISMWCSGTLAKWRAKTTTAFAVNY